MASCMRTRTMALKSFSVTASEYCSEGRPCGARRRREDDEGWRRGWREEGGWRMGGEGDGRRGRERREREREREKRERGERE
eukprot:399093-Rhodomonas_salina.1